jgi:hypothetical protein
MISMELQPAVHMQHLNHGHGLSSLSSQHHNDLNNYQHQMNSIGQDDKQKSELILSGGCKEVPMEIFIQEVLPCVFSIKFFLLNFPAFFNWKYLGNT